MFMHAANRQQMAKVPARTALLVVLASAFLLGGQASPRAENFALDNIPRFDRERNRLDAHRVVPNFRAPRLETYTIDDGLPGGRRIYDGTGRYQLDRMNRLRGPGANSVPLGRIKR